MSVWCYLRPLVELVGVILACAAFIGLIAMAIAGWSSYVNRRMPYWLRRGIEIGFKVIGWLLVIVVIGLTYWMRLQEICPKVGK